MMVEKYKRVVRRSILVEQENERIKGPAKDAAPRNIGLRRQREPGKLHVPYLHDKVAQDLAGLDRSHGLPLLLDTGLYIVLPASGNHDKRI